MTYTYQDFGTPPESPVNYVRVPVVGLWRRFFAYFVDSLVLGVAGCVLGGGVGILAVIAGAATNDPDAAATANLGANAVSYCLSFLLSLAYYVGFWSMNGQTIGKMALGLRVVGENGQKPSVGTAFLRYIGTILSGLILAIGYATIAFDQKKQGWHDKIAKTYVVPAGISVPAGGTPVFEPENPSNQSDIIAVALYYGLSCLVPIIVIVILTALGPQISNTFEQIPTAP